MALVKKVVKTRVVRLGNVLAALEDALPSQLEKLESLIQAVQSLRQAVIQPPRRSAVLGLPQILVRRVLVVTAGTPVQGPDSPISPGYATVVRQRRHTGAPVGYVAGSKAEVGSAAERVELADNDSFTLKVTNWAELWFDADTANTSFELIVEQ